MTVKRLLLTQEAVVKTYTVGIFRQKSLSMISTLVRFAVHIHMQGHTFLRYALGKTEKKGKK